MCIRDRPYIDKRWLGGTLTNWKTIRGSIRRLLDIEEMISSGRINKLIKKTKNTIITSFGSPYLIQDFKDAPVYICAYKGSTLLQKAVGNALIGNTNISGILPVTIPGVAKVGDGINVIGKQWPKRDSNWKAGKELKRVRPDEISVNIKSIQKSLSDAVKDSAFPGGVLLASKDGKIFIHEAFGHHTYDKKEKVTRGDIYDLALEIWSKRELAIVIFSLDNPSDLMTSFNNFLASGF